MKKPDLDPRQRYGNIKDFSAPSSEEDAPFWPFDRKVGPITRVLIPSASDLFQEAKNMADAFEKTSTPSEISGILDFHRFNDDLFSTGLTSIAGYARHVSGDRQSFTVHTDLLLSEKRKAQEDHGYYNYDKVRKIRRYLADEGVITDFFQDRMNRNFLYIETADLDIHVTLGSDSKEAAEQEVLWDVENYRREGISDTGQIEFELKK